MANRFQVPGGSSSPPSTPDRFANRGNTAPQLGDSTATLQPPGSTTPAGHPGSSLPSAPSTAGSFTPAGAPSASFLGSSIMRGVSGGRGSGSGSGSGAPAQPNFMAAGGSAAPGRNLFAAQQERQRKQQQHQNQQDKGDIGKRNSNTPLGRSIRGSKPAQPSRLVMTTAADEDEDEENDAAGGNGNGNGNGKKANNRGGTFRMTYDESYDEDASERERDRRRGRDNEEEEDDYDEDQEDEAGARSDDAGDDMWLDMSQGDGNGDGGSDLMMHVTPAANERARREAESLFRMSAMQSGSRRREHKYAAVARDMYNQLGSAAVSEPPELVLGTEAQIGLLYDRGVGEADDAEKLDDTLAAVAAELVALWHDYAGQLPHSDEEHGAEIGPGPHALPFEKADYLANLALQIHHTRYDSDRRRMAPLPETLFRWLAQNHNLYPDQVEEVLRHRPSPACHSLFWQTVFMALLRGNVGDAAHMLREAGWGHFRRGATGQYAYTGQALENLQHAVDETCDMLETCPGFDGNWEIRGSDWTLFRVRAQGALDQLRRFAEGKGPGDLGESVLFDGSVRGGSTPRAGGAGLTGLARKAQSQVPWDIYENLNVVFEIVLGSETAILDAAQDWCEATAGLFGWWDERRTGPGGEKNRRSTASHLSASMSRSMSRSLSMSRSQALVLAPSSSSTTAAAAAPDAESYLDRLARSFHAAVGSAFEVNALNQVEVGMACIFEDNAKGLIGILRAWSLPVAAAVAEIASLGKWLPSHRPAGLFGMEDLDMDDLEVLGMDRGAPDELDGIKDNTLVVYAHALVELPPLSSGFLPRRDAWRGEREGEGEGEGESRADAATEHNGWELAIHVLGRMDSPERSEEMIEELVRQLLEALNADSGPMVDKIWKLLNELGMITFAEDTAEAYGDILARDSHRYGEAMWYYALAHRPDKVREVMNLLISYSLIQSTAYPPAAELDDYLRRLLGRRNSTLERLAQQDLEAAELLGKMLSGYAALRQFYDIRDGSDGSVDYGYANNNSTSNGGSNGNSLSKAAAAAALISVIASADDNIRGGLYDQTRDGIVSEDFLLALLGEALVFVVATDRNRRSAHHYHPARGGNAAPPVISLPHIDTLLKAIEDLQAVGPRVYSAADEFLQLVLASAPGGAPTDLLDNSSSNKNGKSGGGGGNFVLSGRSVLKSQLQKRSVFGAGAGAGAGASSSAVRKRGWDWRTELPPGLPAASAGEEIVRRLRLGLAQELGTLWLAEADGGLW